MCLCVIMLGIFLRGRKGKGKVVVIDFKRKTITKKQTQNKHVRNDSTLYQFDRSCGWYSIQHCAKCSG